MSEITEFKRMNFFTGFFTTADDWNDGQAYHLEKRRLHNRRLHTPGVMRGEAQGLQVIAAGGLNVRVQPGAALDAAGNEIYLGVPVDLTLQPPTDQPQAVTYVAVRYNEVDSDYVENVEAAQYSGYTRKAERPMLVVTTDPPDNQTWLEVARIRLLQGAVAVSNPVDPANPGPNEIDRRHVVYAGAVAADEPSPPVVLLARVIQVMADKRRDFAALDLRFPVPATADVRHAALTVELLAQVTGLRADQVPGVLATLAAVEQDAGQQLGAAYPALLALPEYQAYQDAVAALLVALRDAAGNDVLLTRQAEAAEAARVLAGVALQSPVADAGAGQSVSTSGSEATVSLDASGSQAFAGRTITSYRWSLLGSDQSPIAEAGPSRSVTTAGDEASVALDAGGSRAFGGRTVQRYHWDEQQGD